MDATAPKPAWQLPPNHHWFAGRTVRLVCRICQQNVGLSAADLRQLCLDAVGHDQHRYLIEKLILGARS